MATPGPAFEPEYLTRKTRIDAALGTSGWQVKAHQMGVPFSAYHQCAVTEFPTPNGPADYVLIANNRILGIIEAKRIGLSVQEVLTQAQRYARAIRQVELQFGPYGVPFLFSTNGETIRHLDVRDEQNTARDLAQFPTPAALEEQLGRNTVEAFARLAGLANENPRLRPYQKEANDAIEAALEAGKRRMLLAMATGTGKTYTTVNQIYRLMKSGVARRILFLVDRRALAAQAVRAFADYEADQGLKFDQIYEVYSQPFKREDLGEGDGFNSKRIPENLLTNPQPGAAFVYVSTIQRLCIQLFGRDAITAAGDEEIDEEATTLPIPIHAFDLLIADECHRGYTAAEEAAWRKALNHFDATKIGLTATPATHTTAYFENIVFRYEYDRAVREGYLVDYDAVRIRSEVRMNGVFLKEGEQVDVVDPLTGAKRLDELEDERQFDASQIERDITAPDSNHRILSEVRQYAMEHKERTGRFPKTLIFAVNDKPHTSHADQLVRLAREVFECGESFVQKITGTVDRPLQHIREFRNRPAPAIVVTVDMLSTGVDIPDLEFIVFLRPVKSRILFTQMLGRGTRKGYHCPDKSHFVVFDCFDGTLLEYFRQTDSIVDEPPAAPTRTIAEIVEDIWQNRDRDYNTRCLVKRLQRIDKQMSGEARQQFANFIPDGDLRAFAATLPRQLREAFTATMSTIRNPAFQDLLVNYPRSRPTFLIASGAEDQVSSEWLVRGADGREYRPADYLTEFAEYVRTHQAEVEAIAILLGRPQEWNPQALAELKLKLASAPQRFTVENLERAHHAHYRKALVDLISMVKHAANEHSPLLSAGERVTLVMTRLTEGRVFTTEQRQWLNRIATHLKENLSLDEEDFEAQPVFTHFGGWGRANNVFGGQLAEMLREMNQALVA